MFRLNEISKPLKNYEIDFPERLDSLEEKKLIPCFLFIFTPRNARFDHFSIKLVIERQTIFVTVTRLVVVVISRSDTY